MALLFKASEGPPAFIFRGATFIVGSFWINAYSEPQKSFFYQSRHLDAKIVVPAMYLAI